MDTGIFHQGNVQSGIARAIQERKVVACLIRQNDDHWSQIWEDYWLSNNSQPTDIISSDTPPLALLLSEKAVLLRMDFGSQESQFLSAFVGTVERAPCLVVIDKGKVLEKLEGGVGREEFTARLLKAMGLDGGGGGNEAREEVLFDQEQDEEAEEEMVDDVGGTQIVPEAAPPGRAGTSEEAPLHPAAEIPEPPPPAPQEPSQPSPQVQRMLSERGQRLENERLRREAAEKAERVARANARRKEAEDAADKDRQRTSTGQAEKQKARDAWLYQQKQRKDEAKKERERILGQIESDKQERRAQALRRKELENAVGGGGYSSLPQSSDNQQQQSTTPSLRNHPSQTACSLQIRLFDGSSIRSKFSSSCSISPAVRTWIREAAPDGGADIPYNLRLIQPPQPSRTIEVGEEHLSLQELGLVPSATLVLVPVAGAAQAYANGGGGGYLASAMQGAYWVANTGYGILGSVLSYVPGFSGGEGGPYMGGTGDEQEASNVQGARMADADSASPGGVKTRGVKTFAEQKINDRAGDNKPAEFYNGNSSAFQGRKDEGDE